MSYAWTNGGVADPDGGNYGGDPGGGGSPDDSDSGGGSVGPSRMGAGDRTDGDAGATITVTSDSGGGSPDDSDSSSSGGPVSDTAIGASYRDATLEQAAERTQGDDAADAVAAGGIASAISYSDTTVEDVAEDTEATGTTESLTDAFSGAFPAGTTNSAEMNPLPEFTGAVERVRERVVIPFSGGSELDRGTILAAVGVVVALGAVVVGSESDSGGE